MDFLRLTGKKILIFGFSNRRSVAWFIAQSLRNNGADVIFSVQNEAQAEAAKKLAPEIPVHICDVSDDAALAALRTTLETSAPLTGIVHSIAFANYSEGIKPFHQTTRKDFLEAVDISCHSLIRIADTFAPIMEADGAIVTISISTTRMASESYGYMAPIKAALDSSVAFLAKSLSKTSRIRVNGVGAGLLKTSASAGIPGYIEPYLFAEKATLRKENLHTEEVADVAAFLLSPRSAGINAQIVTVDAGMSVNYFDAEIVKNAVK